MYKATNGRLIPRRANGRFRKTTLQDLGVPVTMVAQGAHRCLACGTVWRPFLVNGYCPSCGQDHSEPLTDRAE